MGTVISVITNDRTYYECPGCGREVWAFGVFAGTQCWGCTGKNPLKGLFDIGVHASDMGTAGLSSIIKDSLTNNQIVYKCRKCKKRKWVYGSKYVGNTCWDCMLSKHPFDLISTGLKASSQISFLTDTIGSLSNLKLTNEYDSTFTHFTEFDDYKTKPISFSTPNKYLSLNNKLDYDPIFFNYDIEPQISFNKYNFNLCDNSLFSNNLLCDEFKPSYLDCKFNKYTFNNPYISLCSSLEANKGWTYSQSTGCLLYGDEVVGVGYSGNNNNIFKGFGLNNPDTESIKCIGPIPKGKYKIGTSYHHTSKGPITMNLDAVGHNAKGRTLFRIHGDNKKMNYSASQGCIILPKGVRQKISKGKSITLVVVE